MENPLISVIVPAYNAECWIAECCQSVFSQTYSNWELIVVNDGSFDSTAAIVNGIAVDRENVILINQENRGVCSARNTGLNAAKGEYITFLDADDVLVGNALELLYSIIISSSCDIAIGWKANMKENGDVIGCPYERETALWKGTEALEKSLTDHPATYSVWGKLYKRWVVEDTRFVEGKRVHEDSFFLFECLTKKPAVAVTDEIVLYYRISENSASRSAFSEKFFDILYFAERKMAIIENRFANLTDLAKNMTVKAHMALLHNLCSAPRNKYREQEKASIKAIKVNKKYFIPATSSDKKWFFIITHRLYNLYKEVHKLHYKKCP